MSNKTSMCLFPGFCLSDKVLTVDVGVNCGDLEKELSQSFCIGPFRKATTPTQTLPLNVHETTLNDDLRPHKPQRLDKVRIAINGGSFWLHGSLYQSCTDTLHVRWSFGDVMGIVDDARSFSIHHSKDPSATLQKRAVENEVASLPQRRVYHGRTLKPIRDDPSDRGHAMTTLLDQLPQCVSFDNPTLEPNALSKELVGCVPPTKGVSTPLTQPSLPSVTTYSVASNLG
jgi:hypothetical protein